MKTCPACAEQVKDEARVCRYCGHRFVWPTWVHWLLSLAAVGALIAVAFLAGG